MFSDLKMKKGFQRIANGSGGTSKATGLIGLETSDQKTVRLLSHYFPTLIEKIRYTVLTIITGCVSRFANLLK